MKTYSREEAIARIDRLAGEGKTFIFIIDYEAKQAFVELADEVDPNECLFDFEGFTNIRGEKPRDCSPVRLSADYPSASDYRRSFELVRSHLLAGNSYLANLTCRIPVKTSLTMRDICLRSQALYRLWLKDRLVCFSPETFVRVSNGIISSYPMKGTIDASIPQAERVLMANAKEAAEHATIVDLIRNDLSMVADQVCVRRYRYIDRIETHRGVLLQTSSDIAGHLTPHYLRHFGQMLFTLLPAGSISGAPKTKTLQIIDNAENYRRDFYTGVMGCCVQGRMNSAVMIRFIDQSDGHLFFKAGGGITAQSRWSDEYEEVKQKVYVPIH